MERQGRLKKESLSARPEVYYFRMAAIRLKEDYYLLSAWIRGSEQWDSVHTHTCTHSMLGYLLTQGRICTLLVLLWGAVWGIS